MKLIKLLPVAAIAVVLTACGVAEKDKVNNSQLQDSWIDGKVETTLLFNTNLDSFDIKTNVVDGVVTLSGNVDNSIQKQLAGELAQDIKGVVSVNNQLKVTDEKPLTAEISKELTDAKIATVIKSRLVLNPDIASNAIHVSVKDGVVILDGHVPNGEMKDLAGVLAKKTDDVQSVDNNIQVVSPQQHS